MKCMKLLGTFASAEQRTGRRIEFQQVSEAREKTPLTPPSINTEARRGGGDANLFWEIIFFFRGEKEKKKTGEKETQQ